MSAIINSIVARKAGHPSVHVEHGASATTRGHSDAQPGLRGHSVGDTFPISVTGYGRRWIVTEHGRPLAVREPTLGWCPLVFRECKLAHRIAKHCADNVTNTWPITWEEVGAFFEANPAFRSSENP